MGGSLPADVMVGWTGCLQDAIAVRGAKMEDGGSHQLPAQVGDELDIGQPLPDERLLFRSQSGKLGHGNDPTMRVSLERRAGTLRPALRSRDTWYEGVSANSVR